MKMRFERSGRGQEPSRGHKFSILENVVLHRDFTSQTLASFSSDLVGVALVGARPLHLACARPRCRLKAPLGLSLLRCAAQTRACRMAGGTSSSRRQQRETERSRRGTPCCTYRYRLWLLAGCVLRGAPCFCFVFDLLIHGSDCIRSNTLKNGMPEAAASKLPTSPIFQKDLTFPGSSV